MKRASYEGGQETRDL